MRVNKSSEIFFIISINMQKDKFKINKINENMNQCSIKLNS